MMGDAAGGLCEQVCVCSNTAQQGSGGPATVATGPVTLIADHSVYEASDTLTAVITNHLDTTL
jgi:hypothetical protein